jgi:hypothetical protein
MKVLRLLLCLCAPAIGSGQGGAPTVASATTTFTGSFFALTVADLEARSLVLG